MGHFISHIFPGIGHPYAAECLQFMRYAAEKGIPRSLLPPGDGDLG